ARPSRPVGQSAEHRRGHSLQKSSVGWSALPVFVGLGRLRRLLHRWPSRLHAVWTGRSSGVEFGPVDNVKFAEAMGATGFRVERPESFAPTLRKAMEIPGPVIIEVPVDYSHNRELGEHVHSDQII